MDEPWLTLNDGVMGGVSEGAIEWTDSSMVWTGTLGWKTMVDSHLYGNPGDTATSKI